MKSLFIKFFLLIFLAGSFFACEESESGELSYEELQKELERVKLILEGNSQISQVAFDGDEMVLTFANGQILRTSIPTNVIPQVGTNGNWWINGEDLGVKAEAKAPTIGSNGNWFVGTEDTGVKAQGIKGDQGDKGDKGDKGEDGRGISNITYDPETAILTIILSDGTQFPFVIGATGEGNVGGNLIGDLNGEFLLTSITNGDMPFLTMTYDNENNLTNIDYYTNILNAPEKLAGLTQTYNTNGNVTSHRFVEYAEKDKVVPVSDVFPQREYYGWDDGELFLEKYTALELYKELFPTGISGIEDKEEFIYRFTNKFSYRQVYNSSHTYMFWDTDYEGKFYVIKTPLSIYNEYGNLKYKYFLTKKDNQTYFYLPYFYYNDYYINDTGNNYDYSFWVQKIESFDLSSVEIHKYNDWDYSIEYDYDTIKRFANISDYLHFRVKAQSYTGKADVITGKKLTNYFTATSGEVYKDGVSGNYKALFCEYMMYEKGDEIQGLEINYAYSANDIKANYDGNTVANIVVEDNKIKKVIVVENNKQTEILSFKYSGDKLEYIDAPYAEATEVAKFSYDTKGNLTEMSVHSGKLKGKGMESILYSLGLITTHTYYDAELGRVVYGYKYSDDFVPLVKLSYNYAYKNFMNHTLVAANPILSFFKFENAIEEINWAGNGSCLLAEYSQFNEGGYPERVKGILQYSPVQGSYPVNAGVASLYKLKYEKKK